MSEEFDKDGFLCKRFGSKSKSRRLGKPKWHIYYINLIGGSLHYYKEIEDPEPKGTIQLSGLKFNPNDSEGSTKKYCFTLKDDKNDYLFSCEDETEWKEWTTAIGANMTKGGAPPLKKEKKMSRIEQLAHNAKKSVISKATTSTLGKKAIRSHAPEEVKNLIKATTNLVEKEGKNSNSNSNNPEKAKEIEENIFKIGVKTFFILNEGQLTMDDVIKADAPLRSAMELLSKCYDHAKYSKKVDDKALMNNFTNVNTQALEAAGILTKLLEPHMKPNNLVKIKETIEFLSNPDFLLKVFKDDSLDDDLQELISAMEHYTQFHFYSEK